MKKSDKKIDNNICKALTEVCEYALDNIEGYQWITHTVNYNAFPRSLIVTCMFADDNALKQAQQGKLLIKKIIEKLNEIGIKIFDVNKQIKFQAE